MNGTGVYAIRCIDDGRVYVGSAASSFKDRWKQHRTKLRIGKHENRYLQGSWTQRGEASFAFIVLEECPPELCISREQFWIDELKAAIRSTGYNLSPTAGSILGYKHTEAARKAQSERLKGQKRSPEVCASISRGKLGKKLSDEQCMAMSRAMKGRIITEEWRRKIAEGGRGRKHTEKTRQKIGAAHRGKIYGEETRNKISEAHKGIKVSDERRKEMPERRKGNLTDAQKSALAEGRLKRYPHLIGKTITPKPPKVKPGKTNCVVCGTEFQRQRHNAMVCRDECRKVKQQWLSHAHYESKKKIRRSAQTGVDKVPMLPFMGDDES